MLFRLLLVLTLTAVVRAQPATAIVGATVVDGTGAQPRQATVILRGERIEAVAPGAPVPPNARVIRAEGLTLIPGLFDLHTHLPYSAVSNLGGDWGKNLKAYLWCGVTTVTDFGTYPETFEPMRRLIRTGVIDGPRIHLAARISTPGGHGAEGGRGDFFSLEVITPREARAAIKRLLPYQPDAIKVFTDGWRYGTSPDMTSMEEATLAAIVEEAHRAGLEVLTHTVTLEKAKIAARAGVDVIAHGIGNAPVDDELIQLMKAKGVTYAPTLAVYEPRERRARPQMLATLLAPPAQRILAIERPSPEVDTQRVRRWQLLLANNAALRAAGIRLGTGTDAGVTGTYHGWSTLRELELQVEGGLTPLEAITAATGNSARALGVDAERGTIATGKLADLVLVEGEPHRDIAHIRRVQRVFLGGREMDREALARAIASPDPTPIPPRPAAMLIDNFEGERSAVKTLRVNATDGGHDHSKMTFGRTLRAPGNHALSIQAYMAEKARPFAAVQLPLSPGAVEPVNASGFSGIEFDARGAGEYLLRVPAYSVRDNSWHQSPFSAGAVWARVRIPFASLKQDKTAAPVSFTGRDILMLMLVIARPPGSFGWLEVDNVRFYK